MISPSLRLRLEFAAKSFLVTSFLGVLVAGVLRLEQKALADERHHALLGSWSVVESPSWATVDDVRGIRDASGLAGWKASLLDPEAGPILSRSLGAAPQVVRVAALQKRYPREVEAVLEVRRPVAAVRVGDRAPVWIEVDRDGVALGPAHASRPVREGRPLREIVGASGGVRRPGHAFGPEVAEAADLAEELERFGTPEDRRLLAAMDEIEVANFGVPGAPQVPAVVLRRSARAAGGAAPGRSPTRCAVEWGRARPADSYDAEPLFGAKAARLVQVLRMFPDLEGLAVVRLAFEDLVVVPRTGSPLARK